MAKLYCREARAAMIVFDVTTESSFDALGGWIDFLSETGDIPFILVGNKTDLPNRVITLEQGMNYASTKNAQYYDTSAYTEHNVEEAFNELAHIACIPQQPIKENDTKSAPVDINNKNNIQEKKKGCC